MIFEVGNLCMRKKAIQSSNTKEERNKISYSMKCKHVKFKQKLIMVSSVGFSIIGIIIIT